MTHVQRARAGYDAGASKRRVNLALMMDRERAGREASLSAGVVDSQSVKAPAAKERGCDGGKKIVGRKRHIAVDTDGRLLMINPTPANISDSVGAQKILEGIRMRWPWMKHLFADGGYDRTMLMDNAAYLDFTVEIVKRIDVDPRFKSAAATLGRRTNFRLDNTLEAISSRL